jgi:ATP-dependent RNA helicase
MPRHNSDIKQNQHASSIMDDEPSKKKMRTSQISPDTAPCPTFDAMNLKPDLLKGIYAYGFENPSAIQQRAIRPIIRGRDVIAQSQSGTGKTAVFSISTLQLLQENSRETQVIILSPTRELAEQTQKVCSTLGEYMNVSCRACIGGKSLGEDMRAMEKGGAQVVSGTPGRVYDLMRRGALQTSHIKAMILDEAGASILLKDSDSFEKALLTLLLFQQTTCLPEASKNKCTTSIAFFLRRLKWC